MIDSERLARLSSMGRLLDEALDIADACGESLIAAQLAQTLHQLDIDIGHLRPRRDARDARDVRLAKSDDLEA